MYEYKCSLGHRLKVLPLNHSAAPIFKILLHDFLLRHTFCCDYNAFLRLLEIRITCRFISHSRAFSRKCALEVRIFISNSLP